jgi:hypothetical protein
LELLGEHCERFHRWRLSRAKGRVPSSSIFQLDELETFEHNRRLAPVTMPVLIERKSYFVVDLKSASLPARGGLRKRDRERKGAREKLHGRRRSGSVKAVESCIATLSSMWKEGRAAHVQTDRKETYPSILKRRFARSVVHERHSSTARRDYANPLFPINHTLAMMRDGISRLVRRTWAASKLKERLDRHAWIWAVWRNYVRTVTNKTPKITPAMAIGIEEKRWKMSEICAWRVSQTA